RARIDRILDEFGRQRCRKPLGADKAFRMGRRRRQRKCKCQKYDGFRDHGGSPYFRRSLIFSTPARAQAVSILLPFAPLMPIAPTISSPALISTPPCASRSRGSFPIGPGGGRVLERSTRSMPSIRNDRVVLA